MIKIIQKRPTVLLIVLAAFALVGMTGTVFQYFFSDKAKAIQILEDQIDEQNNYIADLNGCIEGLGEKEAERLEEIKTLKLTLGDAYAITQDSESAIEQIKSSQFSIEESIKILESFSATVLDASRARSSGLLPAICSAEL